MLSRHLRIEFESEITRQMSILEDYQPRTHLYYLEAKYTLTRLRELLETNPRDLEVQLQEFFFSRWEVIQSSDAHYLQDFENPANQACIAIAKTLEKILHIPFLYILIPTLKAFNESDYVISPFSGEYDLREFVLSNDNKQLIHVADTLEFAQCDATLKYNCIFPDGKAKALNDADKKRLLSRHPSIQKAYDAISLLVDFKFNGGTVGAALNRLINGLNGGGVHSKEEGKGTEFSAGDAATMAIFEFSQYLETLPSDVKTKLMQAYKEDRFAKTEVEKKTIAGEWALLTREFNRKRKKAYRNYVYCVELVAGHLQEILDANRFLFELCPYEGDFAVQYDGLEQNATEALSEIKGNIATIRQHAAYGANADKEFCYQFLQRLSKRMYLFPLREQDVRFLMHYLLSIQSPEDAKIAQVCRQVLLHARTNLDFLSHEERAFLFKSAFAPKDSIGKTTFSFLANPPAQERKTVKRKLELEFDDESHSVASVNH